jgi:uncharacterized membrane protein
MTARPVGAFTDTDLGWTSPSSGNGTFNAMARPEIWHSRGGHADRHGLNTSLGWLSLGLGVTALAFPRKMSQLLGLKPNDETVNALCAVGVREVVTGVGMLAKSDWGGWPWLRVAGDVMDLALLQSALHSNEARDETRVTAAMATVAAIGAVDVRAGERASNDRSSESRNGHEMAGKLTGAAITIKRSPEDVYQFWRNFENFPGFMANVESIRVIDHRRSHWRVIGPAGTHVEWDAEIVEDRPNEMIAWRSTDSATVKHSGTVWFRRAPKNRGTEIRVAFSYEPPAGSVGELTAKLFGKEPGQEVRGDLRRLKSVLEAGEVLRSDATLEGRSIKQRPAQPPVDIREYATTKS